jgi:hypothetical protein
MGLILEKNTFFLTPLSVAAAARSNRRIRIVL